MKVAIIETRKRNNWWNYSKDAPNTVTNFEKLIEEGFYDGLTFHRVIPNFVIQEAVLTVASTGGPGYTINKETKCSIYMLKKDSYCNYSFFIMLNQTILTPFGSIALAIMCQQIF